MAKKTNQLVSIIIPTYRQGKTIKKDVSNIHRIMSETRWDFEIIVVVDGFVDDTFEKALELDLKNTSAVGYENNRGKGYAVRYGMARASGDIIAFIDAGMEIDANGISLLLEHMEWYDADIVVGSKRHLASQVNYPFIRRLYSWAYYLLVKALFGLRVRDTQTGLKVYRRKVLADVLPRLLVKNFAFDIELLAVANHLGYTKIYEGPIKLKSDTFQSNFSGKVLLDKQIRAMLWNTLAVFYRLRVQRYYEDDKRRIWVHDKKLDLKVNTGKLGSKK